MSRDFQMEQSPFLPPLQIPRPAGPVAALHTQSAAVGKRKTVNAWGVLRLGILPG
jgi:hypothetical protein